MLCLCPHNLILVSNWLWTRKFSQLLQAVKIVAFDFPHHGHALVTALIAQNLTGEFMRKTYEASWILFTLTAEADRVFFLSNCDVFNCLFPPDVQNEIQLLSGVFCYSWLVCLLGFCLRNTSLVKVGNPISDGIVFVFHLAWCVRGLKSLKW